MTDAVFSALRPDTWLFPDRFVLKLGWTTPSGSVCRCTRPSVTSSLRTRSLTRWGSFKPLIFQHWLNEELPRKMQWMMSWWFLSAFRSCWCPTVRTWRSSRRQREEIPRATAGRPSSVTAVWRTARASWSRRWRTSAKITSSASRPCCTREPKVRQLRSVSSCQPMRQTISSWYPSGQRFSDGSHLRSGRVNGENKETESASVCTLVSEHFLFQMEV